MILSLPSELLELVARYLMASDIAALQKAGIVDLHRARAFHPSWARALSDIVYRHKHIKPYQKFELVSYHHHLLGDIETIRYLSKIQKEYPWESSDQSLEHLEFMLSYTAKSGNRECVQYLFDNHDIPMQRRPFAFTSSGSVEVMEMPQFESVSEVNRKSLLVKSCERGNIDVVKYIHEKYYKNQVDRYYAGSLIREGCMFKHEEILNYLYDDIFHVRFADAYFAAEYEQTLLVSMTSCVTHLVATQDLPLLKKILARMPAVLFAISPERACSVLFALGSHKINPDEKITILEFLLDNGLSLERCDMWPLSVFILDRIREHDYQILLVLAKRSLSCAKIIHNCFSSELD